MKKDITHLEWLVSNWNQSNPVACDVNVMLDDGTIRQTKTRSIAWVMGGHTPVVSVDGISGGYMLSRVARTLKT